MKNKLTNLFKTESLYPLYAALLSAAVFIAAQSFLKVTGYGNYTILYGDLNAQYIGFIQMFLRVLKGEQSLWYSFSIYLGSGTALTYTYYTLSPFNLLYLINGISIPAMTYIIITLKISLAGCTFCYFLKRSMKQRGSSVIFFSICYSMSTFTVAFFFNIMWLDCLYMTPLITIFTLEAASAKKTTKNLASLILSFTYLFLTNFYISFMAGVFEAAVFLLALINNSFEFKGTLKNKISDALKSSLRYGFCVGLAAGIGAAFLLPAALFIYNHRAEDNFEFTALFSTVPDIIKCFYIGEMSDLNNVTPFLYCSLPVLMLFPFFFILKNIPIRKKIIVSVLLVFLGISMIFLPLYKFMHAFDYPNFYAYRFTFCIIFVLCTTGCIAYNNIYLEENSSVFHRCLPVYTIMLVLLYSVVAPTQVRFIEYGDTSRSGKAVFFVNAAFLTIYSVILLAKKHNIAIRSIFYSLLVVELTVNAVICVDHRNIEGNSVTEEKYKKWYDTESNAISEINSTDKNFHRISMLNEDNANAPSLFGYYGLNTFSSSDDFDLRKAMFHLGIMAPNRVIEESGYTPVTYALMSTSYTVQLPIPEDIPELNGTMTSENKATMSDKSFTVNKASLPLLFIADNTISDYSPTDNPFENQNKLFSALSGEECVFFTPADTDDIIVASYNADYERKCGISSVYRISKITREGYYFPLFPHIENKQLYTYYKVDHSRYTSNSPYMNGEIQGFYATPLLSAATIVKAKPADEFELSLTSDEDKNIQYDSTGIILNGNTSDAIYNESYYYYYNDNGDLQKICDKLSENQLKIYDFKESRISGVLNIPSDPAKRTLFTTIPFDSDWHLYIDGTEIETCKMVDNAFLSADLSKYTPGSHDVLLEFVPSGASAGLKITIISIILSMITILVSAAYTGKRKN